MKTILLKTSKVQIKRVGLKIRASHRNSAGGYSEYGQNIRSSALNGDKRTVKNLC